MPVIKNKKLPERVIEEIRNRLDTGKLLVGDKLPNQNELSRELGVSRTSLREAMKILDLLGVIEQRPGYGTVIRKKIPVYQSQGTRLTLLSDAAATYELLEAREILECGAVKHAAQKATAAHITMLYDLVDKMDLLLKKEDYEGFKKIDYAFHELIGKASGNRFLYDSATALRQYMQQFIDENTELLPGLLKDSQQYHRSVCDAIASHDPVRAKSEMQQHIQTIAESYKRYQTSTATKNNASL